MKLNCRNNKKSISFFSYDLNHDKYLKIENVVKIILEYENKLSSIYFENYFNKQKISCFDFIKVVRDLNKKDIPSTFYQQLTKKVYEVYNKKKPPKDLVLFRKLSFNGINVSYLKMFEESNNKYSNGIINFNIPKVDVIQIPFRYNKNYHDNLNNIKYSMSGPTKQQFQKSYTCTLLGNDKLKISITIDNKEIQLTNSINHIEGVDVNCKHNLFQISDGKQINYNHKLVKKLSKHKLVNDRIQSTKAKRNLSTNYGNKQIKISLKNTRRCISHIEYKLHKLFTYCNKNAIDHLVFEELNKFTGRSFSKTKDNINYKDLFGMLRLVNVKNIALRMSKNYNVTVSLTNPMYTSQTCNKCGYISKENRKTQEKFVCVKCNYKNNADLNASINIKNRISLDVLRNSLHKEVVKNQFIPIKIKKEEFKNLLIKYLNSSIKSVS